MNRNFLHAPAVSAHFDDRKLKTFTKTSFNTLTVTFVPHDSGPCMHLYVYRNPHRAPRFLKSNGARKHHTENGCSVCVCVCL